MKLFTVLVLVAGLAPVQRPPTIVGAYDCHGTEGEHRYVIGLEVTADQQMYEFAWLSPTHDVLLIGRGVVSQDHVAVAIVGPEGGLGVALYTISPGHLEGVWTRGNGVLDTESCQQGRPV